ncbi:MAG: hypothetical protein A2283_10620 [Lentisphaerae bacterium RIFOXYA12_FULL_48_11]|nr:MAG: hypothetical protein A2283_10620 [Lentisphaerae bacterium RIFOXYA12_FULL_48_11]
MNCFNAFILVFINILALNLFVIDARGQNVSSNLLERSRTVVAVIAVSATETGTMRDMAVIAIKNALAVQLDMEELYLTEIKSGDKVKQTAARKSLDEVLGSVEEARNILQQVADCAGEVGIAADAVKQQEQNIISAKSEKEAERALRNMQKTSEVAAKSAKRARDLAEILKKKWLLPLLPKTPVVAPVEPTKVR